MTKEERQERIEQYLRHELQGDERKEFEKILRNDIDLQQALEFHRELHDAIGNPEWRQFTQLVAARGQLYFDQLENRPVSLFRRYRRPAAAVALLLVAGLAYLIWQPKTDPETLFTKYYAPYQAPGNFRSQDLTELDDDFILGLARYDEAQYEEAAQYLTRTLERDPDKDLAVFLRGLSWLALDSLDLSESDLQLVVADENSLFREQGYWYLGLLYLKRAEPGPARSYLEEIPDNEAAQTILQQLK